MDEPRIRDIPSIKNTVDRINGFKSVKSFLPVLRPFLRLLGVNVQQIDATFAQHNIDELAQQIETLASLPDRFNDLFAERGWIIYELMNLDAAKAAVEKGEGGDLDGAEDDLTEYYSPERVGWHLQTMRTITEFQDRMPLAEKALIDYGASRYHASVPVVLALLDGMVNELYAKQLHEKRSGFFSENTNLEAWDSIAAHSKGLTALKRIFYTGRYKTVTDALRIPYRNGILHGMDLGYDNKMVAAKSWAALFATRDWAIRAEQGTIKAPPQDPKNSWGESFKQIVEQQREMADVKARLEAWTPRTVSIGEDVPVNGTPEAFDEGSPERVLVEFLVLLQKRNYGGMAEAITSTRRLLYKETTQRIAGDLRGFFSSRTLISFALLSIDDVAPAISVVKTRLIFSEESVGEHEKTVDFRLINEDQEGMGAIRGTPNTAWKVQTYYF